MTRPLTRLGFAALACAPLSVALGEGSELPDGSVMITTLPFFDTGDTSDNAHDYDAVCPWASDSPDVFYAYTPTADVSSITLWLCDSDYDTKVFILDEAFNEIACNDDACTWGLPFRSRLDDVPVTTGATIHIAIDGWSGDSGTYDLVVEAGRDLNPPCASGDLNADGAVGFDDLLAMLTNWGPCADPPCCTLGDANGDGTIDFADLLIVLANWGPAG